MALKLLETNAKERCNYFSRKKKQMTAKFIKKSQKIPGGKTANSGSRNSKKNNNINFVSTYPNILL